MFSSLLFNSWCSLTTIRRLFEKKHGFITKVYFSEMNVMIYYIFHHKKSKHSYLLKYSNKSWTFTSVHRDIYGHCKNNNFCLSEKLLQNSWRTDAEYWSSPISLQNNKINHPNFVIRNRDTLCNYNDVYNYY